MGIGSSSPSTSLVVAGTTTIAIPGGSANLVITNGSICVDNDGACTPTTTGQISARGYNTGASDLAENYTSSTTLEAGDIVMAAGGGPSVTRAINTKDGHVIGIVSSHPGITLGLDYEAFLPNSYPIALVGRVPVKVSLQGGVIHSGDRITISSIPGVGMKANATSSVTVAIALNDWQGDPSVLDTAQTGTVLGFVNLSYTDLSKHISGGQIALTSSTTGALIPLFALASDDSDVRYLADRPLNLSGQSITNLKALFSANGKWSLDENGKLVIEDLEVKGSIKVGTPTNRTGVTLFDETNGSPYCIKMIAGVLQSVLGECGFPVTANSTPSSGGANTPTGSGGGSSGSGETGDPTGGITGGASNTDPTASSTDGTPSENPPTPPPPPNETIPPAGTP